MDNRLTEAMRFDTPVRSSGMRMPNLVSRRQFTVEWAHCDPAGIVFNSRFFEYFDWGTWILFETALGVKPENMSGALGIILPLVDVSARFVTPARFGDVVELYSEIGEFRRSSFDVAHRLMIAGALAVEGRESRVWATRDAASPSGIKALPIPDDIVSRFQM